MDTACQTKTDRSKLRTPTLAKVFQAVLIALGALLVLDTLIVCRLSNMNLGVIMPFIIGLPMLICGTFFSTVLRLCRKFVIVRILAFAMIAVYALFTVLFIFTTTVILIGSATPAGNADALIVLGAGIRGDRLTLTLKYRLDTAIEYLNEHTDAVVVVSGGQGDDEVVSEASAMHDYLVENGIDDDRILVEDKSSSTEENFIFSKQLIEERLGSDCTVMFVTTRFHVFRAERVAAKLGIYAEGIPSRGVWYLTINDYLRECAALTQYYLTGVI